MKSNEVFNKINNSCTNVRASPCENKRSAASAPYRSQASYWKPVKTVNCPLEFSEVYLKSPNRYD